MKWKLLHYILPCKELLFKWKIVTSPMCNVCNTVEDYEHYFTGCKYYESFRNKIELLLEKLIPPQKWVL